jgi:cysteine desulfurase
MYNTLQPTSIIYLDHAACLPISKKIIGTAIGSLNEPLFNLDSSYSGATNQLALLEDARHKIATILGTNKNNIFFTSGSTNGAKILKSSISSLNKHVSFIVSPTLHSKIFKIFDNNQVGIYKDELTIKVSEWVNNETGDLNNLDNTNNQSQYLIIDASQAAITENLNLAKRANINALLLSGSKFGALPGSGILYISSGLQRVLGDSFKPKEIERKSLLEALILTNQLDYVQKKYKSEKNRLKLLSQKIELEIKNYFPEAELNCVNSNKLSGHILNFYIPGINSQQLVLYLGLYNIYISTGSACDASKDEDSSILKALGYNSTRIKSSFRISLGLLNSSEDTNWINTFIQKLQDFSNLYKNK